MTEFAGRAALVTGAAGGIGRATAARLARGGAAVMLADLDGQAVEAAAEEIGLETGSAQADVSNGAEVDALVQKTADALGGVDILVNCAGIQRYGTVVETQRGALGRGARRQPDGRVSRLQVRRSRRCASAAAARS